MLHWYETATARPQVTLAPWCPRKTDYETNQWTANSLGAFTKQLRKATFSFIYARLYGTTGLPQDGFSWNPVMTFPKGCRKIHIFIKFRQSTTFYEDIHIFTIMFVIRVTAVLTVNVVTMFLRLMWPLCFLTLYIGPRNAFGNITLCTS